MKTLIALLLFVGVTGILNGQTRQIFFDEGKSQLNKSQVREISDFIETYRYMPVRFRISGHTNDHGSERSNEKLSRERVKSVQKIFIENGIDASMFDGFFFGETKPTYSNNTGNGEILNRRVDIGVISLPADKDAYIFSRQLGSMVPQMQSFSVDLSRQTSITGAKGTEIKFEKGTFVDSQGKTVEGKIELYLTEYMTLQDMVAGNLNTHSKDTLLQTAGTIYLRAFKGDRELALGNKSYLSVTFPGETLSEMDIFLGTRNVYSKIDWKPRVVHFAYQSPDGWVIYPKKANERRKDLVAQGFREIDYFDWENLSSESNYVPEQTQKRTYKIRSLGWINCDRFANMTEYVTVRVPVINDPSRTRSNTFIILPDFASIVQCSEWAAGGYFTKGNAENGLMKLPANNNYVAISFSEINGKVYFGFKRGNTGTANGFAHQITVSLTMVKLASKDQLKESINSLLTNLPEEVSQN